MDKPSRFSQIAFGKAVKKRRLELKMSQEIFAEKAEIHRTYVSEIELGKVNLGFGLVYKVAKALNSSISLLCKDIK